MAIQSGVARLKRHKEKKNNPKKKPKGAPPSFGKGAARRRKIKSPKKKIAAVLGEFKRGTLHSGSGKIVRKKKQAIAIALSEARRAGTKIPKKRKKR